MARYIDADALGIGRAKREVFDNPAYADGWNSAITLIDAQPTADVVEVVRCKDCIYYREIESCGGEMCTNWVDWLPTSPNDFCSQGDRRPNA